MFFFSCWSWYNCFPAKTFWIITLLKMISNRHIQTCSTCHQFSLVISTHTYSYMNITRVDDFSMRWFHSYTFWISKEPEALELAPQPRGQFTTLSPNKWNQNTLNDKCKSICVLELWCVKPKAGIGFWGVVEHSLFPIFPIDKTTKFQLSWTNQEM